VLVLTRRIGEMVLVGDDIQLQILEVRADRVRIGITAPKSLPITRPPSETHPPIQSPKRT
jgi:carbon storage regulator